MFSPIYNFISGRAASSLSKLIGSSLSELIPENFPLAIISSKGDKGHYTITDKEGNLFRLGLYLETYNKSLYRKAPSLHIDFCEHVSKLKHRMRATNTQFVTYYSMNRSRKYENERLLVCKKCLDNIQQETALRVTGKTFDEFILSIEEDENLKCTTINNEGYVINWKQISSAFRSSKNYQCEICNFKLTDFSKTKFMHTHHINSYDKLNNRRSNLQCLCVKCHSEIDTYHVEQFSSLENQLLLSEFEAYTKSK